MGWARSMADETDFGDVAQVLIRDEREAERKAALADLMRLLAAPLPTRRTRESLLERAIRLLRRAG